MSSPLSSRVTPWPPWHSPQSVLVPIPVLSPFLDNHHPCSHPCPHPCPVPLPPLSSPHSVPVPSCPYPHPIIIHSILSLYPSCPCTHPIPAPIPFHLIPSHPVPIHVPSKAPLPVLCLHVPSVPRYDVDSKSPNLSKHVSAGSARLPWPPWYGHPLGDIQCSLSCRISWARHSAPWGRSWAQPAAA